MTNFIPESIIIYAMKKIESKQTRTKKLRQYLKPGDRVEKLEAFGAMGYISANEDMLTYKFDTHQLAFRRHFSFL